MSVQVSNSLPTVVNINHYQGQHFRRDWKFYTDNTFTTPLDITGDTFKLNICKQDLSNIDDPEASFDMDNFTITGPNILTLEGEDDGSDFLFQAGIYAYDLLHLRSGKTLYPETGTFTLIARKTPNT